MGMATGTVTIQPLFWLKQQLGDACVELPLDAGQELVLDDPRFAYLTLTEQHQLHCATLQGDGDRQDWTSGRRAHVAACPAGQLLLGTAPVHTPEPRALVLTGVAGTCVWRVPVEAMAQVVARPDGDRRVGRLLNGWIRLLLDALPEVSIPEGCQQVKPGETVPVQGHGGVDDWQCAIRAAGDPCWIAPVEPPTSYRGIDVASLGVAVDCWPLREDTVAICPRGGFRVWSTARLLAVDATASFTQGFTALVIADIARRHQAATIGVPAPAPAPVPAPAPAPAEPQPSAVVTDSGELADVLDIIHRDLGMAAPRLEPSPRPGLDHLQAALARSNGAPSRPVRLDGDGGRSPERWWTSPGGPLLAFMHDDDAGGAEDPLRPVALLPRGKAYRLFDPRHPRRSGRAIDPRVAACLHPQAHQFYRALPARVGRLGLLRFLLRGSGGDLLAVGIIGAALGLLGLLLPVATGLIFDHVVPGAQRGLLAQIVLVLLSLFLGGLLFDLAQGFALARLQTRLDAEGEAALWDRLLRLPLPFFRQYTAGELAARVGGVAGTRDALAGAASTSILAGVFSLWNLALLFYLDVRLALACAALVLAAGLVALVTCGFQWAAGRRVAELQGKLSGLLFQLMGGIARLRVASAERRAFGVWANLFARRRSAEVRLASGATRQAVFAVIYPLVASGVLFYLLANPQAGGWASAGTLSTARFLAFYAAFGSLLSAGLALQGALIRLAGAYPLFQRARPILTQAPEASGDAAGLLSPGELTGRVEISHLSFRYHEDSPPVLDDVSLRVHPGQCVAIVGPSGSGKSTLLKLLLGLETPSAGSVYYDGQALSSLDVRAVRQQLGAVLQNGAAMAGSMFENIAGSSGATLEQAWQAARQAGLDRDIEAMPMGMNTPLALGRGTLSGGQRQRLLLARALAQRPRLLLLDETTALDNQAQAQVTRSLEALKLTRVVVTHRLATIAQADHIVVLDRGRVVEQGSYQALLAAGGRLSALVDRQVT